MKNNVFNYYYLASGTVTTFCINDDVKFFHQSSNNSLREISLEEEYIYRMVEFGININEELVDYFNSNENGKERLILFKSSDKITIKKFERLINRCIEKNIIVKVDNHLFLTSHLRYKPSKMKPINPDYQYNLAKDDTIHLIGNLNNPFKLGFVECYLLDRINEFTINCNAMPYSVLLEDATPFLKKILEKEGFTESDIQMIIYKIIIDLISKKIVEVKY